MARETFAFPLTHLFCFWNSKLTWLFGLVLQNLPEKHNHAQCSVKFKHSGTTPAPPLRTPNGEIHSEEPQGAEWRGVDHSGLLLQCLLLVS